MQSGDSLQRFIFEHAPIRGEIVHLDSTWRAVLDKRTYPPVLANLLGEFMAAAALLSATIKYSGTMTLQLQGEGPVKMIVVECTSSCTMRAWAQWLGNPGPGSLRQLTGDGKLAITIDPGTGSRRYQGIVMLEGLTVAEALRKYLSRSEQLDTHLWLAADGARAAGLLLQKLPESEMEDEDAWNRAVMLGETITRSELLELPAREIVIRLYHEDDIRLFSRKPVSFRCSCSKGRVNDVFRMLGRDEINDILNEMGKVTVNCEFCGQRYVYDRVDIEQIFAATVISQAGSTRH